MPKKQLCHEDRAKAKAAQVESRRRQAEEAARVVDDLLSQTGPLPAWAERMVPRARAGHQRSLIALKCGDCACWQKEEIVHCEVKGCPLLPLRPFRARRSRG